MKPVILFVDDEPNVLGGLKRISRDMRAMWEMEFAEGGQAAIDLMAEKHFDAIVTDMRMPVVDGAAVLKYVAAEKPFMVRFVLSGEADRELTYRTVGYSHQFHAKPCDGDILKRTLGAILERRADLKCTMPAYTIGALDQLWAHADHYEQFVKCMHTENPTVKQVAAIAKRDPGLFTRILQLSNSAYFGNRRSTLNIETAISAIGLDVLRDLSKYELLTQLGSSRTQCFVSAVDLATAAQGAAIKAGAGAEHASAAYAIGMALSLGRKPEVDQRSAHNTIYSTQQAAYTACLLGLPSTVIETLDALEYIDVLEPVDENALRIVEALETLQKRAA